MPFLRFPRYAQIYREPLLSSVFSEANHKFLQKISFSDTGLYEHPMKMGKKTIKAMAKCHGSKKQ